MLARLVERALEGDGAAGLRLDPLELIDLCAGSYVSFPVARILPPSMATVMPTGFPLANFQAQVCFSAQPRNFWAGLSLGTPWPFQRPIRYSKGANAAGMSRAPSSAAVAAEPRSSSVPRDHRHRRPMTDHHPEQPFHRGTPHSTWSTSTRVRGLPLLAADHPAQRWNVAIVAFWAVGEVRCFARTGSPTGTSMSR